MRIYDVRIGRFLTLDPLEKNFPSWSPYQFAGNSPIYYIDKNGERPIPSNDIKLMIYVGLKNPNFYAAIWTANNTSFRHLEKIAWYEGSTESYFYKNGYNSLKGQMGQAIVTSHYESQVFAWHLAKYRNPIKAAYITKKTFDADLNKGIIDIQLTFKTGKFKMYGGGGKTEVNYSMQFSNNDGSTYKFSLPYDRTTKVNIEVKTTSYSEHKHKENITRVIMEGVNQALLNAKEGEIPVLAFSSEFWDKYKNDPRAIKQIDRLRASGGHLSLHDNLNANSAEALNGVIMGIRENSSNPNRK
jgi:hypothetical protein